MRALVLESLARSFLFVLAINVLGIALTGSIFVWIGFLMVPGIWLVYGMFDVNNHDMVPFLAAELINVVVYSIPFAILSILRKRRTDAADRG